ncbi:hypothetical protein KKD37_04510 [Patescibacteria group bacterium]|nr:hypothetical protein [Patescibacteria group bacterium]
MGAEVIFETGSETFLNFPRPQGEYPIYNDGIRHGIMPIKDGFIHSTYKGDTPQSTETVTGNRSINIGGIEVRAYKDSQSTKKKVSLFGRRG